jgi:hypothetical protein
VKRGLVFPTLLTLVMLGTLLWLGSWQLERREWKHALIARLQAAPTQPLLTANDYYMAMVGKRSVQYRRAELPCNPGDVLPYDLKGGTSATGIPGYLLLVSCRPNRKPPEIVAVAGWTRRPDAAAIPVHVDTVFRGLIIEHPYGNAPDRPQFMLIPDTAVPPLQVSQMPQPEGLPDNHLSYALQWFGLAAVLATIYAIWLRRKLRGETVAAVASPK